MSLKSIPSKLMKAGGMTKEAADLAFKSMQQT